MSEATDRLNAALEGRYRIERPLGEGGMATVYLADDLKHERNVALKVLKPELAAVVGAGRFLAEITTTANLQHPHILPLFDSGQADGFLFYVMPYVEGESLRERLDREHQLPVDEAVQIASDVASALDYAHRHGVIHRDIKPANILLSETGEPLVSDFGIALAVSAGGGDRLTETGLSLGTPHYMSPEQATGDQNIGPATDTYALGCVLYEMLVGEPPYTGSTPQAVLGKIVMAEPEPVTAHRKAVPANVEAATAKALEKLPADRFTSAAELIAALDDPTWSRSDPGGQAVGRYRWNPLTTGFAALSVVLAVAVVFMWQRGSRPDPVSRFVIGVPPSEAIRTVATSGGGGPRFALTPDGSTLIYEGPLVDGVGHLWIRRLDELHARSIAGTQNAVSPFVSPDGSKLAFLTAAVSDPDLQQSSINLRTMTLDGRETLTVMSGGLGLAMGGSWGTDGFLYAQGGNRTIIRVPATGGAPSPVTSLDTTRHERSHAFPHVLPEDRAALFVVRFHDGSDSIAVVPLPSGRHRVLAAGNRAAYSAAGYVVIGGSDGAVRAAEFDLRRLRLTSEPAVLGTEAWVREARGAQWSEFAVSGSTLAYLTAGEERSLVWVTRDGEEEEVDPHWRAPFRNLALSSDGRQLAVDIGGDDEPQVWVKEMPGGSPMRLTFEGQNDRPSWRPDGDVVLFRSNRRDLYEKRADGLDVARLVLDVDRPIWEGLWSADGQWLIYRTGFPARDIFAVQPGSDTTMIVSAGPAQELWPAISPSGRWIAYTSNETGQNEVYVRPFPDASRAVWLVSNGGGSRPLWSHDGRELFYWTVDLRLVAVQVSDTASVFRPGPRQSLFSFPMQFPETNPYQVGPDGRFLIIRQRVTDPSLVIVQNFQRELERPHAR